MTLHLNKGVYTIKISLRPKKSYSDVTQFTITFFWFLLDLGASNDHILYKTIQLTELGLLPIFEITTVEDKNKKY